jgi:hypothetical protein
MLEQVSRHYSGILAVSFNNLEPFVKEIRYEVID